MASSGQSDDEDLGEAWVRGDASEACTSTSLEDVVRAIEAEEAMLPLMEVQDVGPEDYPLPLPDDAPGVQPPKPLSPGRGTIDGGSSPSVLGGRDHQHKQRSSLAWSNNPRAAADAPAELPAKVTAGLLHQATLRSDPDLVRRLIGAGASVNVPIWCNDPAGDVFVTLLHVLSSRPDLPRSAEVIAEIARGKANLNARSFLGSTPLARACLHKHLSAAELLLELGADTSPLDDRGRSALHCAVSLEMDTTAMTVTSVESVSGGLVSLLAGKRADLNSGGDVPPLLEAIRHTNRPAVAALIRHGAKPRFLHVAIDQAPACVVEDLLKGQANPLEEDKEGRNVLDIAFRRGDEEITTLLRDSIGDFERRHHGSMGNVVRVMSERRRGAMPPLNGQSEAGQEDENTLGFSSDFKRKQRDSDAGAEPSFGRQRSLRRFSLGDGLLSKSRRSFRIVEEPAIVRWMSGLDHAAWIAAFKDNFAKFQMTLRRTNRHRNFQLLTICALLAALFCPDLWTVCDLEGKDLDTVLVLIFVIFTVELLVQTIGMPKTYVGSFFFWMDIVGLLSVPLDHSLISGLLPNNLDNAVVMRAARTARLGARAGRFTKLVKLLRFLPGVHQDTTRGTFGTAKTMSNALMTSLSTRVSCLIIVMVMVLPLFDMVTYPENDFSMQAWMNSLDLSRSRYNDTVLEIRISEFEAFYDGKDYYPFEVYWASSSGATRHKLLKGEKPHKYLNQMDIKADSGLLHAFFNFGAANRVTALCNMILIVVIIILMMGFSLLLSNSVSVIVLIPLENLLRGVQRMASKIFQSVTSMAAKAREHGGQEADGVEEGDVDFGNEIEMLEKVIDKLATLSAITMKSSPIDAATLEQLGESDRAVLQGFNVEELLFVAKGARKSEHSISSEACSSQCSQREDHTEELVVFLERRLEEAGLDWGLVDSWNFNALDIQEHQRHLSCLCFVVFHLGLGYTGKLQACLISFLEAASAAYGSHQKIPYHNWYHAVDVTHCVFRLLNLCATEHYFSNYERFALVTSAICHDIGHPGFNNPFLVETAHELAIRYNDHSPLENMHCARLFELVGHPKTAVFGGLDRQQYREVRQVCIEAILHTDNIHHFPMVKDLQMLYEMNSDVFDIALQMHQSGQLDFPPRELVDIFTEPDKKKLLRNLFLHFSDVSNPTKPFPICKRWAWNIIDEFFLQGDREKQLGIAVQPLNDRDKVNRPYSQVGFIEFFIAPFAFATVRLLPTLVPSTDQMMMNLNTWCEEWVATTTPAPEPEDVAKLQDRIAKLEAKFIFREGF